ncbi:hypothetical protein C8R43DRAFT_1235869 [Mycena crocata]|nr:hypothetical protein C8R43DRAFT_1235869 [Mycena crocata]
MSTMVVSPNLSVQELWDHIIDLLHLTDLKSFSFVCRSFVNRAQSRIFRSIYIWLRPSSSGPTLNFLTSAMSTAPHLFHYVRRLTIPESLIQEAALLSLAGMNWTRLEHIAFDRMPSTLLYDSVWQSMRTLVALPSLRSLAVETCNAVQMYNLFAHCGKGLEKLEIGECLSLGLLPTHPVLPHLTRPVIRELSISRSPKVFEALNDPAFPLDVTALNVVEFDASSSDPGLATLLHRTSSTVKHLKITGDERQEYIVEIDFNAFTSLNMITIWKLGPVVEVALGNLPAENRVTSIHLRLSFTTMEATRPWLPRFESLLLLALPNLQEVQITVWCDPAKMPWHRHELQIGLPRLHEKQILSFFNVNLFS